MVGETKWFYTHPHHANPSRNLLPTTRPFLQKALCLDTIALLRAVVLVDVVVEVKTTNVSKTRKQVQNANKQEAIGKIPVLNSRQQALVCHDAHV